MEEKRTGGDNDPRQPRGNNDRDACPWQYRAVSAWRDMDAAQRAMVLTELQKQRAAGTGIPPLS